ncbi:hypothetical protein A2U01_0060918, partial [Trifolium medium]|nr:hypothetical protein [Trifolium medium]
HIVDQCYKKHGLPSHLRKSSSANAAIEGGTDTTIATSSSNASPSISQAQYDTLMSLLQNLTLHQAFGSVSSNQVGSSVVLVIIYASH